MCTENKGEDIPYDKRGVSKKTLAIILRIMARRLESNNPCPQVLRDAAFFLDPVPDKRTHVCPKCYNIFDE